MDGNINQGIKCLKSEKFSVAVDRLYELYDKYKGKYNVFLGKGNIIDISKTIEQNRINDGDKVILPKLDESSIIK